MSVEELGRLRKWQCGRWEVSKAIDGCRNGEALSPTPQHPHSASTFSSWEWAERLFHGVFAGISLPQCIVESLQDKRGNLKPKHQCFWFFYTDITCANAQQPLAAFLPCVTDNTGRHQFHLVLLQSRAPNAESSWDAALGKIIK